MRASSRRGESGLRGSAYGRITISQSTQTQPGRTRRAVESAKAHGASASTRGRLWIENQDPGSGTGATIGWVRRYQAADGQLYAVLLSAYLFLTVVPLLLVASSYAYHDPTALAKRMEHRLRLSGATATLFEGVLSGASGHKLTAALIAIVDLFFFGLGFGRVLQLAHARSWGIDLRKRAVVDQARYFGILAGLAVLVLLYIAQTKFVTHPPTAVVLLLDLVWLGVLFGAFVWGPLVLLDGRVSARDIIPGAIFTVVGLLGLRLLSVILLHRWLEWYSKTYGGFGFVMALFFWLILAGTILVLAAALSPALAHRRDVRQGKG